MTIDSIQNGYVLDHIPAGMGMRIYKLLGLDKTDAQVALIQNAKSSKMGKKDVLKIATDKFDLNLDVVAYLASNISANVREIEGAISSLVANASFLGRKITTSLAKEILKVYVQLYQKEITIDHIIEVVCNYLNLDFARFNSTERTREIAQARQIAMYLIRRMTNLSLKDIGKALGNRDHSTVMHSLEKVEAQMRSDPAFAETVKEITTNINAKQ